MRIIRIVLSAMILLCGSTICSSARAQSTTAPAASTQPVALDDPQRVANWQADIAQLAAELPQKHKNAFFSIRQKDWEQAADNLRGRVPIMTDVQVALGIARLVAMIGDGHTMAGLDFARFPVQPLPIGVRWFSDGLFIVQAVPAHKDLLGAKILAIGPRSIEDGAKLIAPLVPHDNDATLRSRMPGWITLAEALLAAGLIERTESVSITVRDAQGQDREVTLKPLPRLGRRDVISLPLNIKTWPLGLQQRKSSYWFEFVPDRNVLYCRYDRCADDAAKSVKQFSDEALEAADSHADQLDRVIIDLRNNGGGNSALLGPLIKGLKSRERLRRERRVFALIGNRTFSSGMLNAWDLVRDVDATLVGEPTGGKPNGFGEIKSFKLNHSGINIQYSTKLFFLDKADPPSLMPHITVETPFADFAAGRDPVFDAAMDAPIKALED